MKQWLAIALAFTLGCSADYTEVVSGEPPEQWQLRRPGDESLPMGPAHVPPPPVGMPTETEEEYYERLKRGLPEGAEAPRPEHQQPMPAYIERALFIDGTEETRQFNADGTEFTPEPTGFALTPDGDPEIDAPTCAGTQPCPCYTSGWHKDADWFGSAVLQPGVCYITDSPNITYNFVQKLRDGSGGFSEFAEPSFIRNDYFSSNWTTELGRLFTQFETAPDFTMTYRPPLVGWGPYPPGFYALPGMPFMVAYPPDRLKYPALTDLVFRVGVIPKDKSWYGSHSSKALVGLTKTFFVAPTENPTPVVNGVFTQYNGATLFPWTPRWTSQQLRYAIAAGSIVTIDQDFLFAGRPLAQAKAYLRHVICHEIGHSLGLDHLSDWQGSTCMSDHLDIGDPATSDYFFLPDLTNSRQDGPFCDPSKGDPGPASNTDCKWGYRPPMGLTEY